MHEAVCSVDSTVTHTAEVVWKSFHSFKVRELHWKTSTESSLESNTRDVSPFGYKFLQAQFDMICLPALSAVDKLAGWRIIKWIMFLFWWGSLVHCWSSKILPESFSNTKQCDTVIVSFATTLKSRTWSKNLRFNVRNLFGTSWLYCISFWEAASLQKSKWSFHHILCRLADQNLSSLLKQLELNWFINFWQFANQSLLDHKSRWDTLTWLGDCQCGG